MHLSIIEMQSLKINTNFLFLFYKYCQITSKTYSSIKIEGIENIKRDLPVIFLLPKENYDFAFTFISEFSKQELQRNIAITLGDVGLTNIFSKLLIKSKLSIPYPTQSSILSEDFKSQFNRHLTARELEYILDLKKNDPKYKSEIMETASKYTNIRGGRHFDIFLNKLYEPWLVEIQRLFENTIIYNNLNIITYANRSSLYPASIFDENLIYHISKHLQISILPIDVVQNTENHKSTIDFLIRKPIPFTNYPH